MVLRRGTGEVKFDGRTVYGVFVVLEEGLRVRVSTDDWERLRIRDRDRVEVAIPPGEGHPYFVWRTTWNDPGYWVELVYAPDARSRRRRTG